MVGSRIGSKRLNVAGDINKADDKELGADTTASSGVHRFLTRRHAFGYTAAARLCDQPNCLGMTTRVTPTEPPHDAPALRPGNQAPPPVEPRPPRFGDTRLGLFPNGRHERSVASASTRERA